jgi:hypothetical protein
MCQQLRNQPLGVPRILKVIDNASTNVSINDNDNDEFIEGVSDEQQAKKNLGTNRKINFQEEALHVEKRKIKIMEERLMKSPKPTKTKSTCPY